MDLASSTSSFGGEQRHPADLAQVDPDEIAGAGAPARHPPTRRGADRPLVVRGLEDLDPFVAEQAHNAFEGIGRQVGAASRAAVISATVTAPRSLARATRSAT